MVTGLADCHIHQNIAIAAGYPGLLANTFYMIKVKYYQRHCVFRMLNVEMMDGTLAMEPLIKAERERMYVYNYTM